MASTRIGNVLRARICRAQKSNPGIEKGNGIDDQCREKGEGLMTSAKKRHEVEDICREKGDEV
jgi:hypothetical protein